MTLMSLITKIVYSSHSKILTHTNNPEQKKIYYICLFHNKYFSFLYLVYIHLTNADSGEMVAFFQDNDPLTSQYDNIQDFSFKLICIFIWNNRIHKYFTSAAISFILDFFINLFFQYQLNSINFPFYLLQILGRYWQQNLSY